MEHTKLSDKLTLTESRDGYWLWDATQQMNLSMRAKSPTDALVEALGYYQRRLGKVEAELRDISDKVEAFVAQFAEPEDDNA